VPRPFRARSVPAPSRARSVPVSSAAHQRRAALLLAAILPPRRYSTCDERQHHGARARVRGQNRQAAEHRFRRLLLHLHEGAQDVHAQGGDETAKCIYTGQQRRAVRERSSAGQGVRVQLLRGVL